jgi:hypothetical protein
MLSVRSDVKSEVVSKNPSMLLMELTNKPAGLCDRFVKEMSAIKVQHEAKYTEMSSDAVKLCFYEFDHHVNQSVEQFVKLEIAGNTHEEKAFYQKKYLELCGFLWSKYDSLTSASVADQELKNSIGMLLHKTNMNRRDDLPSRSMAAMQGCVAYYKSLHPVSESLEYVNALYDLRQTLKSPASPDYLVESGRELIRQVEAQKNVSSENVAYCTRVIKETHKLIAPAAGASPDFNAYKALANEAPGKPKYWKAVTGAMLRVAGVVAFLGLIGLSLFAIIATGGAATAFSILGIKAALAIPVYLGIGVGSHLGSAMYASGKRQGLSQSMVDYNSAAEKYSESPQVLFRVNRAPVQTVPLVDGSCTVKVVKK